MITVKATVNEWDFFSRYLDGCITGDAKTIDQVKEYYLAMSLDSLNKRIKTKLAAIEIQRKRLTGPTSIKIQASEILALSIYFNRYQVHSFIQEIEKNILNQMPTEIINVLNPINHVNKRIEEFY